ncbi:hypothetical protein LOTGIDRAFT_238838 [Lottia gigantea]|uniref:Uncharacterized protein n=1 Tax=Lottia gigantea TaxID=225164 RepID=V4APL8_LOTGI|nr:hypothetical protein LOTGIDRAFT_238838 [Lottia gigantea]ESO99147.1 hypothetical protein LOTGIDRAFT_238838 [Lottia gigantea]
MSGKIANYLSLLAKYLGRVKFQHETVFHSKNKEEENKDEADKIKTNSSGTKTYQQSLPHVLSNYGLDNNRQKKKKSAKVRKERRTKRRTEFLEDEERDKEREKLKEEKYLSVVDDLHKLKNYYYREYRDLLTEKIIRQRLEIKDKSEAMLASARQKEQEEREANKSKARMTKHKLVHNEDFLKNVEITETARIVNLQTKLQKEGKLKSQSDIDEFWRNIKNPNANEKYFDKNRGETPDSVFGGKIATANRPLSQINESSESSRPTTRGENWAVTQQYKHQHKGPGNRQKNNSSAAKQAMDKRFASVDMPPLHCFTMDLSEKPPDPEMINKRVQLKAIEKQRKKFMGKLHKMHQLAMANNALASRFSVVQSLNPPQILSGQTAQSTSDP